MHVSINVTNGGRAPRLPKTRGEACVDLVRGVVESSKVWEKFVFTSEIFKKPLL